MRIAGLVCALSVLMSSAVIASAQGSSRAVVNVIARDSTGFPVADAELTITRGLHDVVSTGRTDQLGRGKLAVDVKDATDFNVTVRKIGYPRGDRFFSIGATDTANLVVVVGPRMANTLETVKVTEKANSSRFMSYYLGADEIESENRPSMDNAWEVVKQLRPAMLTSRGGCATGIQNVWVNGERIRLPLLPTGMARARALVGVPPNNVRFSYVPVTVLSEIAPEYIESITYKDCFDHSMAVVGTQNAVFIVLKPGVVYQQDVGSFVVDQP